ncbi:MAG: ROK family protein [Culicoidibacterales bacterium]
MKTIGIDIGGTQTRVAVFEGNQLIAQQRFATDTQNPKQQVQLLAQTINELTATYEAIGVACPGPLDVKTGTILNPPNLPGWHNFPLQTELEIATKKMVVIDNDANLAAFAEAKVGAGKCHDVVQFITLSTGVGAGLVVDERIFHGARGFAQEVANVIVDEQCDVSGETVKGSVERICSGTGIYELAKHQGLNVASTAEVFALAQNQNQVAIQLIDYVANGLANFLASLQGVIDPSIIIVGGSVALHNPEFIQKIAAKVKTKVYANVSEHVQIVIAECGDAAGVVGAGLWAQKQHKLKMNQGEAYESC